MIGEKNALPTMRQRQARPLPPTYFDSRFDATPAQVQGLRADVPVGPSSRVRPPRAEVAAAPRAVTRVGETPADDFFRHDAERLGYLAPGGEGLRAYYRDFGMVQPKVLNEEIYEIEVTNWDFDNSHENEGAEED